MNSSPIARLLIVDDETALMTALCNTLQTEGYATTGFTSAREALAKLRERQSARGPLAASARCQTAHA